MGKAGQVGKVWCVVVAKDQLIVPILKVVAIVESF